MLKIIIYFALLAGLLYWLGGILMEQHTSIQQELMSMEDE